MIIVDAALEKRQSEGNPIRVGLVGAGYMGRGIALEIITGIVGMKLVAISNRTIGEAKRAYKDAGILEIESVDTVEELEKSIDKGHYAITDDALLLCKSGRIDAIIEATGEVEFGATVALKAIENGKHLVLINAELDATIGPILKIYADHAGVVITDTDGDEPGVAMNLYRFVKTIGYRPVLAGNIKGFIDPYRTPDTQREFASKHNQKPRMITSFADGTKLSMETTILANATGFKVGKRGMFGHHINHVKDLPALFSVDELLNRGWVDYALGAEPGTGAFVIGHNANPIMMQYMSYFKMGDGPLYVFYTPYHLPHLQLPSTLARAVLFHDATVAPIGAPSCDVITIAKRDLKIGEFLDGIGGFTCFGMIENVEVSQAEKLLPMGLSNGCRLKKDIFRDQPIAYNDIDLPKDRLSDKLSVEQDTYFFRPKDI